MSTLTTINLIQAANRTLSPTYFKTVPTFDKYPLTAESVRLPMILTWPDAGTWSREGFGGKKRDDTVYVMLVFVAALGQGEMPARSSLAVELRDALRTFWLSVDQNGYPTALQNPGDETPPTQVTLEFDGQYPQVTAIGGTALTVGGTPYTGFELRIKVRELW